MKGSDSGEIGLSSRCDRPRGIRFKYREDSWSMVRLREISGLNLDRARKKSIMRHSELRTLNLRQFR